MLPTANLRTIRLHLGIEVRSLVNSIELPVLGVVRQAPSAPLLHCNLPGPANPVTFRDNSTSHPALPANPASVVDSPGKGEKGRTTQTCVIHRLNTSLSTERPNRARPIQGLLVIVQSAVPRPLGQRNRSRARRYNQTTNRSVRVRNRR